MRATADTLVRLLEISAGLLLAAIVLALGIDVIARYVFSAPLPWSYNAVELLAVWMFMLGIPLAYRAGAHYRLVGLIPRVRRDGLRAIVIDIVIGAFCVVAILELQSDIWVSWQLAPQFAEIFDPSGPGLGVYRLLAVPVGLLSTEVLVVSAILDSLSPEPEPD